MLPKQAVPRYAPRDALEEFLLEHSIPALDLVRLPDFC